MKAMLALLCLLLSAATCGGQVLRGPWVDAAEQAIEQHRKVTLKVIVLNEQGDPAPRAPLRVVQAQHAFDWGVQLDREILAGDEPASAWRDRAVWRCFSAVSLEEFTGWSAVQPAAEAWDFALVDRALVWAEGGELAVRWGPLTSADLGKWPAWAASLPEPALRDAVESHVRQVATRYGRRVRHFDVHTDMLQHQALTQRLGAAIERRLYQRVQAGGQARAAARFEDALLGEAAQRMIRHVTAMRERFVPVDVLAVEATLPASLVQTPLARSLEWMASLNLPVVVCNLRLAAGSEAGSAVNLETALRTLFATPHVQGVWFGPITTQRTGDLSSALIDDRGEPTDAGKVFDRLVHEHWWTDSTVMTDELGSATLRVFAGRHDLTALVGQAQARAQVFLPAGSRDRLVVLQPLKAEAAER